MRTKQQIRPQTLPCFRLYTLTFINETEREQTHSNQTNSGIHQRQAHNPTSTRPLLHTDAVFSIVNIQRPLIHSTQNYRLTVVNCGCGRQQQRRGGAPYPAPRPAALEKKTRPPSAGHQPPSATRLKLGTCTPPTHGQACRPPTHGQAHPLPGRCRHHSTIHWPPSLAINHANVPC